MFDLWTIGTTQKTDENSKMNELVPEKTELERLSCIVFNHWMKTMKKNPKTTKFLPDRQKKTIKALKIYGLQPCLDAIEGCASIPFNMGHNSNDVKYNDLELIMRKVEYYMEKSKRYQKEQKGIENNLRTENAMKKQKEEEKPPASYPPIPTEILMWAKRAKTIKN